MNVQGIIEVPYLEGTPARVNHKTGHIIVSKAHFDKMDPVYKDFVLAHEEGHYVLQTLNEELADEYAARKLLEQGKPLSKILQSLTRVLNYDKDNHYGRTKALFDKLLWYDYQINGNKEVINHLNELSMETPDVYTDIYAASFEGDYSDFLGLGKKAAERRQARHEAKMEKKHAKNLIREAKAEEKKAKADAIREGKYQPESFGASFGKALGGVANVASSILGGKGSGTEEAIVEKSTDQKDEPKKDTTKWIFIGLGVLVLIILAYFFFFKKGKK